MGKLITVEKPKKGDDVRGLYQVVSDLIDELNDITVSITPTGACIAKISPGDIELDFSVVTKQDASDRDPNYGEGGEDVTADQGTDYSDIQGN